MKVPTGKAQVGAQLILEHRSSTLQPGAFAMSMNSDIYCGDVTLTDKPEVLNQIELNVANNVPSSIIQRSKVSALSWGINHYQFPTDYDIILGSDIVYKKREYHLLLKTLQHLSNQNTIIYICSKMREFMGAMNFHEKLIPQHFNSEIVHSVPEKEINLYKVTKKVPGAY
ncbi:EEF1A lysine methyltransferase 3-like [Heptranchias perlo]|uniref:EEF1A lysine methyltransferase 3-like n=1 Tax=Heptranchias perlo TaxID=212740 RepID=UPI00355A91AA